MECPTYKIRHSETGQEVVVNAYDYVNGLSGYMGILQGGKWSIVGENHRGGREGFDESGENALVVAGIRKKRRDEKVLFNVVTK
jgi:hypothetical protein